MTQNTIAIIESTVVLSDRYYSHECTNRNIIIISTDILSCCLEKKANSPAGLLV